MLLRCIPVSLAGDVMLPTLGHTENKNPNIMTKILPLVTYMYNINLPNILFMGKNNVFKMSYSVAKKLYSQNMLL